MGNVNLEVDEVFKDGNPREDMETSERQLEDEGGDVRRAVKDSLDGPEHYSISHQLINFKDVNAHGNLVAIRYHVKESLHLRCRHLADYALLIDVKYVTPFFPTTTMPPKPKPPSLPVTTQQIAGVLSSVSSGMDKLLASSPNQTDILRQHITTLLAHPTHPPPSNPIPKSSLDDIADIKRSLSALQKALSASTKPGKPPPPEKPPQTGPPAKPKTEVKAPSYAGTAALPPRPSVVISLSAFDWTERKPTPAQLCSSVNSALTASQHEQVHISAARWTARDNLILMGGPNTMAHQLQLAIPTICQHFSEKLLGSHDPTPPPHQTKPKMVENSHQQPLIAENPTYAALTVTQRPSWVRSPTSYSVNTLSSLVVVFKDLDGSLARGLMASKTLFIFGHCATLRKWKQQSHPSKDKPHTLPSKSPSPPDSPIDILDASFRQLEAELLPHIHPSPHTARPPQGPTQGMKGAEEDAGRPQPAATCSST
ncbi:hypothetical protein EDB84DRAFT_1566504 [Lactarius hengduanensis]|nr:hypothetical protein EDB84DRAFT_1566504 [Lactarius hengduanensis]